MAARPLVKSFEAEKLIGNPTSLSSKSLHMFNLSLEGVEIELLRAASSKRSDENWAELEKGLDVAEGAKKT